MAPADEPAGAGDGPPTFGGARPSAAVPRSPGTVERLTEQRSRTEPRRIRQWLLVDGNRLALAGVILVGFYAVLVGLHRLGLIAFADPGAMTRIVGGTVAGVLSLITIVLAINQLIVNPELGHAGQTMDRLEGARSLKEQVESVEHIRASPVEPVDFLVTMVDNVDRNVAAVERTAVDADEATRTEVGAFVDHVGTQLERIDERFEDAQFDTYNEVLTAAHRETSWLLFVVRRFWREHGRDVPEETEAALDELLRSLELFQVAQNYFKTTYVQRELATLSRLVLFASMPAVTAAYLTGMVYAGADGFTISTAARSWVVPALLTVALSPLAIFSTYILRVTTLVSETVHVGPFTTVES